MIVAIVDQLDSWRLKHINTSIFAYSVGNVRRTWNWNFNILILSEQIEKHKYWYESASQTTPPETTTHNTVDGSCLHRKGPSGNNFCSARSPHRWNYYFVPWNSFTTAQITCTQIDPATERNHHHTLSRLCKIYSIANYIYIHCILEQRPIQFVLFDLPESAQLKKYKILNK